MAADSIDRDSDVPPYLQLAAILRARIARGDIPAGRRVPSQMELEAEFGLSRNTIRKAIDVLREDGLVRTVPGLGIYVQRPD